MDKKTLEKLEKLKSIRVCAGMTCATMDMGLEYFVITSEGAGSNLGDLGQWPCLKFPIDDALRQAIRGFTGNEKDDIKRIENFHFFKYLLQTHNPYYEPSAVKPELAVKIQQSLVEQLPGLDLSKNSFFGYQDWGEVPLLSSDFNRIEDAFIQRHGGVQPWTRMSEAEIEEWHDTAKEYGWGLPLVNFSDED